MIARSLAMLVALALTVALCGCAAQPAASHQEAYQRGDHATAHREAVAATRRTSGEARERAALIAGLSADAMGRTEEAERWLRPLATSKSPEIAGRAGAALGLIELRTGRTEPAAVRLTTAATKLSGDNAARAGLYAGDAYAELGRPDAARTQYRIALNNARDVEIRRLLVDRIGAGGYTIQLGAFGSRFNAERALRQFAPAVAALGLGEPRVRTRTDDFGRTLYLVQVGRFATRDSAADVRRRIGTEAIVALAAADDQ